MVGLIPAHAGKTPASPWRGLEAWAHPRSRGENPHHLGARVKKEGSSPLTRGKPRSGQATRLSTRLIPAHAGKTGYEAAISARIWAHPRSRGENLFLIRTSCARVGSSPLTRGKHTRREITRNEHGLIPAHAGKTTACPAARPAGRAHPRSRGDNEGSIALAAVMVGSSPLTRGKRTAAPRRVPAGVAHPRSRGENFETCASADCAAGSSPLTRGKLVIGVDKALKIGLIPAHAGKTVCAMSINPSVWAHPRSRGENTLGYPYLT